MSDGYFTVTGKRPAEGLRRVSQMCRSFSLVLSLRPIKISSLDYSKRLTLFEFFIYLIQTQITAHDSIDTCCRSSDSFRTLGVVKRHFTTSYTHPNPYPSLSQQPRI